jgi:hypothetical protein
MRLSVASQRVVEQPSLAGVRSSSAPSRALRHSEKSLADKLSPAQAMRLRMILAGVAWIPVIGLLYLFFG